MKLIGLQELVREVRRIAWEHSDFNYRAQKGTSCSYLGASRKHPDSGTPCIIGLALSNLGWDREYLKTFEGYPVGKILARSQWVNTNSPTRYDDLLFLATIQFQQDEGKSWGEAAQCAEENVRSRGGSL